MSANVQIIFYSMYGHIYQLANAIAEGVGRVDGATASIAQVPETLPNDVLEKMGAIDARKVFAHVPTANPDELADADAIILGSPTRYGSVTSQMQAFLDATGKHWMNGNLIGKVGSAFTSTASQHGGQETTLLSISTFFYHQGMLIAGVPYSTQQLLSLDELSGGTPYGATTIAGGQGQRQPSENELAIARAQGQHVASIAVKLAS